MSVRTALVSFSGIFEYKLVMRREASVKCGAIGVSRNLWSRSAVFFMLKMFGRGAILFILCVNSLESCYAGALRQFTTGLNGGVQDFVILLAL